MSTTNLTIVIAKDFSVTPGPRHENEGAFSGEAFREKHLLPAFKKAEADDCRLVVDLDGTEGYATSFLEEAFGGLAREFSPGKVLARLELLSTDEPYLKKQVEGYIRDAKK